MAEQTSLLLLVFMVFGLGLRHGLDLDHLATIDSITRSIKNDSPVSKKVGLFFSLGHGLVVILLSLIIGSGMIQTQFPAWLESLGNWISIFFLMAFGLITLWKTLFQSDHPVLATGLRSLLFRKHQVKAFNPFLIVLVGALFALSFDTFSQVALFSISMSVMAGGLFSAALGVVFMFGMMASDGLNGIFIASLIQRADGYSAILSRLFGCFIAAFSLILGAIELMKQWQG